MFTAYFDESGTHAGSSSVVVGGYISSDIRWAKFQKEWQAILDEAEIALFRMTDFRWRQGQFKGWSDQKCDKVRRQVIGTIRKRTAAAFGFAVHKTEYEAVRSSYTSSTNSYMMTPYAYCVSHCLKQVAQWADKHHHTEPIAYIFESGAGCNGELESIRQQTETDQTRKEKLRFSGLSLMAKTTLNPLQAADVLVYWLYQEMKNCIVPGKPEVGIEKFMIELLKGTEYYCTYAPERPEGYRILDENSTTDQVS